MIVKKKNIKNGDNRDKKPNMLSARSQTVLQRT